MAYREDEFIWVEKYRPRKIAECILPESLKKTFQAFVDQENIPGLLLVGKAGTGKTTVARAMLEEIGADYIIINGSLNGNIDALRNEIQNFASSVSFSGGRKYVILDEADGLSGLVQQALRNFMEEYSKNCGFIFTANYVKKIIEPIWSRTSVVEFNFSKAEIPALQGSFMKRVRVILDTEGVEYEKDAVAATIVKYFPDNRRILNELQRYAATGKIDSGILANLSGDTFKSLIKHLKDKDFTAIRKWVAVNPDVEMSQLFQMFYDMAYDVMKKDSIPQLVLHLANYDYKQAFVTNPEINLVAALTEIMVDCEFA